MAPDLSEKLLGIDIDDADDRRRKTDDPDEEAEELAQFLFFGLGDHQFAVPVDTVRTLAEVPDEVTRVPRAPTAIEGMMDLRGEITAVIDPQVHFPNIEPAVTPDRERLLVLDRPADEQSAALHVDDVIGVETVPESDVFAEATVAESRLSGDALDHPLVAALIEQAHEPRREAGDVVSTGTGSGAVEGEASTAIEAGDTAGGTSSGTDDAFGGIGGDATASLEFGADDVGEGATGGGIDTDTHSETDTDRSSDSTATREIVIEATPVVNIERLLLASGQRE